MELECRARTLKDIVAAVRQVNEEAEFKFDEKGLLVQIADESHVCMIELKAAKSAFAKLDMGSLDIPLTLEKLSEVLSLAEDNETVRAEWLEEKRSVLWTLGNLKRRMAALDKNAIGAIRVPKLDLSGEAEIKTEDFQKAISAAEACSDNLDLKMSKDGFQAEADGDTERVEAIIPVIGATKCDNPVRSIFPLDYMKELFGRVKAETMKVQMGQEYPLKVSFIICEGVNATYILAPRIEEG